MSVGGSTATTKINTHNACPPERVIRKVQGAPKNGLHSELARLESVSLGELLERSQQVVLTVKCIFEV